MWLTVLTKYWKPLVAVLIAIGLLILAYNRGYSSAEDKYTQQIADMKTQQAEALQKSMEDALSKSVAVEKDLANQRQIASDLDRKLKNAITSNKIYSDCVLPVDGVQLHNQAIAARTTSAR